MSLVNKVEIKPGYRTDLLNSIELALKFPDYIFGRGFWKFHNSLLYDKVFVENVKKTIYSVLKYKNIDSLFITLRISKTFQSIIYSLYWIDNNF